MYPYKERQIKWDDYGEFIKYIAGFPRFNPALWLIFSFSQPRPEEFVPLSELNQGSDVKQEAAGNQDAEMAPESEILNENSSSNSTRFFSLSLSRNEKKFQKFFEYNWVNTKSN